MILEARNLSYAYKSQKSKQILEHVSLIFENENFIRSLEKAEQARQLFCRFLPD